MPRQQTRKQFLNFVKGLNTESSPLAFPENTAKDLDNVDLDRDGSIRRRRGMEYEAEGGYSTTTFTRAELEQAAVSTHEWESVASDDTLNFSVTQIGGSLYFHTLGDPVLSTSVIGKIDLSPLRVREDFDQFVIDTAVGKGKLFIVSRGISPAYIQYNKDLGTFEGVKQTIKVRDIDGIPENRDSPNVFGDDINPGPQTDPIDDVDDVSNPEELPGWEDNFTEVPPPNPI